MKISIASDHGGYDLKEDLKAWLAEQGHEMVDFGCQSHDSCDYADFCEPAARAVAEGGSFSDCMKAVVKGVGSSISDLEAYRKAVRFYFPQAEVRFVMTLETGTEPAETGTKAAKAGTNPAKPASGRKILDLTDFL